MTKEEILAMEPGPELDILVAEKVMGHPMPDFIPEDALDLYLAGTPIHRDSWTCVCLYDEGDTPKWVPDPYSTDISAAWPVVEKMNIELFSSRLFFLRFLQEQTIHEVSGTGERVTIAWPDVFFHITPETICKAALITKTQMSK